MASSNGQPAISVTGPLWFLAPDQKPREFKDFVAGVFRVNKPRGYVPMFTSLEGADHYRSLLGPTGAGLTPTNTTGPQALWQLLIGLLIDNQTHLGINPEPADDHLVSIPAVMDWILKAIG